MRSSEDYLQASKDAMKQAKTLLGKGEGYKTDKEFLESMARSDASADHPDAWTGTGTCGCCGMLICMAQTARDMLAAGDTGAGAIQRWSEKNKERWEAGKYFQFYQAEKKAGRDPHKSFEERGWEM